MLVMDTNYLTSATAPASLPRPRHSLVRQQPSTSAPLIQLLSLSLSLSPPPPGAQPGFDHRGGEWGGHRVENDLITFQELLYRMNNKIILKLDLQIYMFDCICYM
jgi:hypothetical protein